MAIQMRRGLSREFDPSKMLPGEWAVAIDTDTSKQIIWMCFAPGVTKRMGTYEDFRKQIEEATHEIKEQYLVEFNVILDKIKKLAEQTAGNTDTVLHIRDDIVNTYLPQILDCLERTKANAEIATQKAKETLDSAAKAAESDSNSKIYKEAAAASETNAKASEEAAKVSEANAKASEEAAAESKANAEASQTDAAASAEIASQKAENADNSAIAAESSAGLASEQAAASGNAAALARSYSGGGTGTRENEDIDNARYYKEQAERIADGLKGSLLPMGTISFAELPDTSNTGYMYNVKDEFVTTDRFKEGAGNTIAAGANVYYTADGYWDCMSGSGVAGIKGAAESKYRNGNINITPENIGLGNVPDVATNDQTPTYTQAAQRENLESGEKLSIALGKIKKWFAELKGAAFAQIAYNDTTTVAGYVADARAVTAHGKEIDALNEKIKTKQDSATAINTGNIGSQSVNHANTADSAQEAGFAYDARAASCANYVEWNSVGNKPAYYPPSSHGHNNYLPNSGGVLAGELITTNGIISGSQSSHNHRIAIGINGRDMCTFYEYGGVWNFIKHQDGKDFFNYFLNEWGWNVPGIYWSGTLNLKGSSYLNLCSGGIQCRNYNDTGWAGISASGFHTQSSKRYKENIKEMTTERAKKILDIEVVTFDYKDGIIDTDRCDRTGVIVEDAVNIIPEAVSYREIDNENVPDGADYSKYVPYVIKMQQIHEKKINELIEIIHSQQEQINDLKNRIMS